MISFWIKRSARLRGTLKLDGDKSITHRAIILSSIACGKTRIFNPAFNQDCLETIRAFKQLGVKLRIFRRKKILLIYGRGRDGLKKPRQNIYVGASATTMRLLTGLLAGQKFPSLLCAGPSLSRRPMKRIIEPLRKMGAKIFAKSITPVKDLYPPLKIQPSPLKGINYRLPIASAQVKSAILLAGLYAKGKTCIIEPLKTRDHTERMLALFGADIKIKSRQIILNPQKDLLSPGKIYIPADISSASFFIVAAVLLPDSWVKIKSVSLNPQRLGFLKVLRRMGAHIKISHVLSSNKQSEPQGEILAKSSSLHATRILAKEVPSLIDELPILMVAACFAKGKTEFRGIEELRVKETDRINSLVSNLTKMGAEIASKRIYLRSKHKYTETLTIKGPALLEGCSLSSFGDHRTAMSLIIAGLKAEGQSYIDDVSCIAKSFPDFIKILKSLLY